MSNKEKAKQVPVKQEVIVQEEVKRPSEKFDPEVLREENEEKFTDFLNFFEFIGVLYSRKHLTIEQVSDVFDYYLRKIKSDADCQQWINQYSFEKLKLLLEQFR